MLISPARTRWRPSQQADMSGTGDFSLLIDLLREIVTDPAKLRGHVPKFQNLVWHSDIDYPTDELSEIFGDLAYDLDFYEPDSRLRSEDSSYFGEERALKEIKDALAAVPSA